MSCSIDDVWEDLKFLNLIDKYSWLALAIVDGIRYSVAELIDTLEDMLNLSAPPMHLLMDIGS